MYKLYYLPITILLCTALLTNAQKNTLPLQQLFDLNVEAAINDQSKSQKQIELPFPDGQNVIFKLIPNQLLSEELQTQYPDLQTFDLRHPSMKGKMTINNGKAQINIRTQKGMLAILPSIQQAEKYKAYYGAVDPEQPDAPADAHACEENEVLEWNPIKNGKVNQHEKSNGGFSRGGVLTTYRLAVVTTGEFEDANGSNSMARITSTVQAWNLIYEADLGVRITLVNTKIYDNPTTDPFDANGDSRVNQAAEALRLNFPDDSYDIGHVFHNSSVGGGFSGGGVAGVGVVCNTGTYFSRETPDDGLYGPNKAAAWSGSYNNTTNGWIQLSAHELGHQFNASHTFNGNGSNCSGGNVPQRDAYEIGSGSTIMSYNGLCGGGQNLSDGGSSDNYFHVSSIERMIDYITTSTGSFCGQENNIANTAPTITANPEGRQYTIPINTPFELTGAATDAENDELSYCWEQYDEDGFGSSTHGKVGSAAASDALAPLFRSFSPSSSPTRTFPALTSILNGSNVGLAFEALPSVNRSMTFAFTVRDNNPIGGSIVSDNIEISVENTGGAFKMTSQNAPTTLQGGIGGNFNLTWDVAGTTGGNIQCAQVDILFSTDGGMTFPIILAENTSNDGSQSVMIPAQNTTQGRIKIIASDNIFFDINDADITITNDCEANGVTFSPDEAVVADEQDSSLDLNLSPNYNVVINNFEGRVDGSNASSNLVFDDRNGNCSGASNPNKYEVYEFITDANGEYTFTRSSPFGQLLNIYQGTYDTRNVCNGWLGSTATRPSGSGGVRLGRSLSMNLSANTTYSLVVSSFNNNGSYYGDFTVTYSGPGQLLQEMQPDPGFAYTYVIINDADNSIAAFEDDPDLSTYRDGNYTIYGLERSASISTATLNNDYASSSFSNLQNDINTGNICADLSDNLKLITINDTIEDDDAFPNNIIDNNTYDGDAENDAITIRACQTIIATSDVINGAEVIMIAGASITLKPGFFAQKGSLFTARIEPCPPANVDAIEEREAIVTTKTELTAYPNPTSNELHLQFSPSEEIKSIKVYDQLGRIVKYWATDIRTLSLANLGSGMYILLIETEEEIFKQKIIKQ
ncbi:MAG: M12 family metallo-peptidase [Bacteroidota bacterium]